jgi:hypothetical protein
MSYFTLDEAAEWLTWRLGGAEVLGAPVTATQILRFGIHGHLLVCVALDTRCYSPTTRLRNESAARLADPEGWFKGDTTGRKAMDAATVEAFGFFIVPPRTLFGFEAKEIVSLRFVTSLDGANSYYPFEEIGRDRLRVMHVHLSQFAEGVKLAAQSPGGAERQWSEDEKMALRAALDAGQTQAALGRLHGITGERVAQLAGRRDRSLRTPPAPTANNPFPSAKSKRTK